MYLDSDAGGMMQNDSALAVASHAVETTPVGLVIQKELSFEEWAEIGSRFGTAMKAAAWCIGDWLVYGERQWGKQLVLPGQEFDPKSKRIPSDVYDRAIASTGMDRSTLWNYASVCRAIPIAERDTRVSFTHHMALASLPKPRREEWMSILISEMRNAPTVRRLRVSMRLSPDTPRIVEDDEITSQVSRHGQDNCQVHIQRLTIAMRNLVPRMTAFQRAALWEDTEEIRKWLEKCRPR